MIPQARAWRRIAAMRAQRERHAALDAAYRARRARWGADFAQVMDEDGTVSADRREAAE